ncbi:DMT family transporter [Candidatus Parcubacteria bacterium]|jgi:drug/metabolite transporter (DMT)-like permease|nr:DMT family transporter [Candidatus Parcubacteria bacterium]MBT3948582.1 DMT family transporter [Candidatus Parcubacteria bacterium]
MTWIFLAILAHFFWALVNIGDKYAISNKIKNPYVYLVWLTWMGIITVFLIPFVNFSIPPTNIMLLLILSAGVYFYGGLPYVKAVQIEEITRVNIWWNLIPFFSLFIGWIFIGEKLILSELAALFILVLGAVVASFHFKRRAIVFSKALWLMVIACFSYAIYAVIFRYITQVIPFVEAFIWFSLFMIIFSFSMFISKRFRKDFIREYKHLDFKLGGVVAGVSILDNVGIFFNIWALSLGPAALVFAFEGTQVLFVFIMATLLSIFFPKIIKEELDKRNVILKIVALVIMVVGILILNLG